MIKNIKQAIRSLSMQRKMILVFAVPVILTYLLLNSVCYSLITDQYEERLRTLIEQSQQQTAAFIDNYIYTMHYLTDLIANNADVQEILGGDDFTGDRPYDVQYREYYRLNKAFLSYEVDNPVYRIGLYIPDEIMYSRNQYSFYGESRLEERADYSDMQAAFALGRSYYGMDQIKKRINDKSEIEFLSLFTPLYSTDVMHQMIGTVSVSVERTEIASVLEGARFSDSGLAYIVDQNGDILLASDMERLSLWEGEAEFPHQGGAAQWQTVRLTGEQYYVMRTELTGTDWQMISLIPIREYRAQQGFLRVLQVVMGVVILAVVWRTATALSRYYVGRLTRLNEQMTSIQSGDLNAALPMADGRSRDEIETVYQQFNYMVGEVRRLLQEHYRLGKDVRMSELRALQSQINPHFLYNTLDLINWMAIDYGATEIEDMVWNLSRFYRLSLNQGRNVLTIREELEHVQAYVNIENIHFDQAIHYEARVPEALQDKACLNIILQPFVENAILHGMNEHPEIHEIEIRVDAEMDGQDILFHVSDTGAGMDAQQVRALEEEYMQGGRTGYGIRNINFRIKLSYGEQYGVSYDSAPGRGTTAHIRIPVMDMDEAERELK